jgi:peptidoglycan/LPS O-acetylase OafA/YrhL
MPNLDLLRSIAVLLVAVEHTLIAMRILWISSWNIAWVGVAGVFMFFVHTSLVLMWSFERNPQVLNFYIRRIFRIYPLAIAAILAIVIFRIPLLQNPQGDTFFKQPPIMNIVSNMLLMQNLGWRGNILGVMWSLPLEVDMYFCCRSCFSLFVTILRFGRSFACGLLQQRMPIVDPGLKETCSLFVFHTSCLE